MCDEDPAISQACLQPFESSVESENTTIQLRQVSKMDNDGDDKAKNEVQVSPVIAVKINIQVKVTMPLAFMNQTTFSQGTQFP